jgi:hypothetical protein
MDNVQQLTALVWQFGPFAFAIIFVFLVSRQCNSQYLSSVGRTAPVATSSELWMYRSFFILTFLIGCGLSIYSVIWWSRAQHTFFVYDFRITGVGVDKKLVGVDPVIPISQPRQQDDGTLLYEFIVLNDGPFQPGQKFTVAVTDATGAAGGTGQGRVNLSLPWEGHPTERFRIILNGTSYNLESY